jgi:transcriptional regulator with XRE-family HTH domain
VSFISLVELGRHNPNLKTINKLSKAMKVSVWEIFLGMERDRDLPKTEYLKFKGLLKKGPGKPPQVDAKGRRIHPIRERGKKRPEASGKARRSR